MDTYTELVKKINKQFNEIKLINTNSISISQADEYLSKIASIKTEIILAEKTINDSKQSLNNYTKELNNIHEKVEKINKDINDNIVKLCIDRGLIKNSDHKLNTELSNKTNYASKITSVKTNNHKHELQKDDIMVHAADIIYSVKLFIINTLEDLKLLPHGQWGYSPEYESVIISYGNPNEKIYLTCNIKYYKDLNTDNINDEDIKHIGMHKSNFCNYESNCNNKDKCNFIHINEDIIGQNIHKRPIRSFEDLFSEIHFTNNVPTTHINPYSSQKSTKLMPNIHVGTHGTLLELYNYKQDIQNNKSEAKSSMIITFNYLAASMFQIYLMSQGNIVDY